MDVITSLEPFFHFSQIFGLVSFEVRHQNGIRLLCVSGKRLAYTKLLFAVFCLLQVPVIVKTAMEAPRKGLLMGKCVRLLHLLCFSADLTSMYLTAITKGGQICRVVNLINRLSLLLPRREECRKVLSRNPMLMSCVFVYFPTIFLSSLHTITSYRKDEWYGILRSSFFAFNTWMENLFLSQFFMIANSARAVAVGYNENFVRVPSKDSLRSVNYIKKMKSGDLFLKSAFHLLNSVYQYNLLFGTSWLFMALIYFINKGELQENFFFWAFYTCFRMIIVLGTCDRINQEVEKTAHHLHELFIEIDDPQLKEEIEIFSLQLMHRKAEFNACGFFKLDFSLLHSMIATVSTYIIILMQLQEDTDSTNCMRVDTCSNCSRTAT